jgi:hypothetical protein
MLFNRFYCPRDNLARWFLKIQEFVGGVNCRNKDSKSGSRISLGRPLETTWALRQEMLPLPARPHLLNPPRSLLLLLELLGRTFLDMGSNILPITCFILY